MMIKKKPFPIICAPPRATDKLVLGDRAKLFSALRHQFGL
jgi:hypothetical protein